MAGSNIGVATATRFERFILPGLAFKAVIIGGGYATGRELAEFFGPSGARGGLYGMLVAMLVWSMIAALTFLYARAIDAQDYRSFFRHLLGPFWPLFELQLGRMQVMSMPVPKPGYQILGAALLMLAPALKASAAPDPAALQTLVTSVQARHPQIPSISATVMSPRHKLDWTGVAGHDRFGGTPLSGPQPFRIASATKPFVSVAVLRLVEAGRLRLADPIAGLVSPETAAQLRAGGHDPQAIRLRHLLEHSAGLPDHAQMQVYAERILADPTHEWTRKEQVALAMQGTRPLGAPGEGFIYSDTGYVILGEIVERASGKPLAAAVRELAGLDRLRLASTWWEAQEPVPARAAPRLHQYLGTVDNHSWSPSFDLFGGGGLVSTTPDLATWYRAALTGSLFSRPETMAMALATPTVRQLGTPRPPHAPLMPVAKLGDHSCWGHGGFWGTMVLYCPDIDTAVAVAVNANAPEAKKAITELLDGIARELEAGGIR
jgi:D-alanyl-D-alanine carboxypeptidase